MKFTFKTLSIALIFLIPTLSSAAVLPLNMGYKSTDAKTAGGVTQLQNYLGIYPTTGFFGTVTRALLKDFQKRNNLPQTGTTNLSTVNFINQITPVIQPAIIPTPVVTQPLSMVSTTTWEKGTVQTIFTPESIRKQNHTVSVRLLSQNDFAHDDIYTIVLNQPNTTSYQWLVGTSTAQNMSSTLISIPAGKYILEICADTCVQHPSAISIPRVKAPQSQSAVMASLSSMPVLYNYIDVGGDKILDENGSTYDVKPKIAHIGSTLHIYARTKETPTTYTPSIRVRAYNSNSSYPLLATSSIATEFKLIVGQDFSIPNNTYSIEVCISNVCNIAREKLQTLTSSITFENTASSTYSVPSFMSYIKSSTVGTSSVSRYYSEKGELFTGSYPLIITEATGDISSYNYIQARYINLSTAGYKVYDLSATKNIYTKLVRLSATKYLIIEGRSSLVDFVAGTVRGK
ncbi:MAG: peptidoglycan-binding domain-containing protein [Patescibacteria group bacterium]